MIFLVYSRDFCLMKRKMREENLTSIARSFINNTPKHRSRQFANRNETKELPISAKASPSPSTGRKQKRKKKKKKTKKTYRPNRLPQILRPHRIQYQRQPNRPHNRRTNPLQHPRHNQHLHTPPQQQQQRRPQQRRQSHQKRQLPRRQAIGQDARDGGEEDAGAGVGGKETGDVGLDLGVGQVDAVLEDEGEDGDDEAVEEEVGEEADADGADDEEGAGTPGETEGFGGLGHYCCFS